MIQFAHRILGSSIFWCSSALNSRRNGARLLNRRDQNSFAFFPVCVAKAVAVRFFEDGGVDLSDWVPIGWWSTSNTETRWSPTAAPFKWRYFGALRPMPRFLPHSVQNFGILLMISTRPPDGCDHGMRNRRE